MANEDKATRYHRLQRRAGIAATLLTASTLTVLLLSGGSAALRDALNGAAPSFLAATSLYIVGVVLLCEIVQLPSAFYQGVVLERRYGLSTQVPQRWWRDHLKAMALGLLFSVAAALLVWSLIRWAPRGWWLAAAAVFTLVMVLLAQLAPVLLLPIFYEFKPLDRPRLVERLVALAERAGAGVLGVFEWRLGDRTRKANAALTGIGRTRRILLSDTLLADHSDDEIEVILAHEIGHHVHRDIWRSVGVEALRLTIALFAADQILTLTGPALMLAGKDDIAAMPLLMLTAGAVLTLLAPLANGVSRAHERRADRYALELTQNVTAFTAAMRRLAAQNLAEEHPSRLVELLFHTHPSAGARIAAARHWEATMRTTARGAAAPP